MRRLLLLVVALGLVVAPTASADVSGPEIVSFLNTQRAAQGIPAGIAEDPARSDGCARHNAYGAQNDVLTHGEDPGRPGYTPEGDQAAQQAVLYQGETWTAARNPFEEAPIHLHQLLAPRLDRLGASENQGYGCATTLASRERPAPAADVTYTYPGDGATGWPAAQTARERPFTPGEQVGIPEGTKTGPYLYVMFDGPDLSVSDDATATGATLTGPDGPVPVAVVDNDTLGAGYYLPTGLEMIPRAPLAPLTTYTAQVTADVSTLGGSGPARSFAHTWSFTTRARDNAVSIQRIATSGRHVGVEATSDAPGATVTATGPGTTTSRPLGEALDLDADGEWTVCVRSGGGSTGYLEAQDCQSVSVHQPSSSVGAKVAVKVPRRIRRGRRIRIRLTAKGPFSLRLKVKNRRGRTVASFPPRPISAGSSRYSISLPRRLKRRGRLLRLQLLIVTDDGRRVVRRRVRFR